MRRAVLFFAVVATLVAGLVPGSASAATAPRPTALEAIGGPGVATLTWRLPPDRAASVTAYRVYRDGQRVAEVTDLSAPVWTDTGLGGGTVAYQVSAVTAAGEGPRSPVAEATVQPAQADAQGGTERRVFTYSIATRGQITANLQHFAIHVAQTYGDPRGWSLGGSIEFRQVDSGGNFTVYLAQDSTVPSFGSPCSSMWSCRVGNAVIINQTRWQQATSSWVAGGGSLDSYRHYVVNHETGHWLGFGHASCPGGGQLAPVMQQQSIDLQGCRHNTWPVPGELQAAGSRHGADVRLQGAVLQHAEFGRQGDHVLACDWNGDGIDTAGMVDDGHWKLRNRNTTGTPFAQFDFGRAGGMPVPGDWDGNGRTDPGMVQGRAWIFRRTLSGGAPHERILFGTKGVPAVAGHWLGLANDLPGRMFNGGWNFRRYAPEP